MRSNFLYSCDKQRTFRPEYKVRKIITSQRQRKYNENSMSRKGSLLAESKWD